MKTKFGCNAFALLAFVLLLASCSNAANLEDLLGGLPDNVSDEQLVAHLEDWQRERQPLRYYKHLTIRNAATVGRATLDEGFKVREHPPFSLAGSIDWAADPYNDRNWRYQLNAIYPAITYMQAYLVSSDQAWFDETVRLYLDWIDFNMEQNRSNEYKWYDMATGIRAINLAFLIDHGVREKLLSPTEVATLLRAADRHVAELGDMRLSKSNHGLFQVAGIAAVCRAVPELKRCDSARQYANREFAKILSRQFNSEGVHLEHSPDYHTFAFSVIQQLVEAGFFDLAAKKKESLRLAVENFDWFIKPDRTTPAFGDSSGGINMVLHRLDPEIAYLHTRGKKGNRPPHGIKVFEAGGYAVVRHYESPQAVTASDYLILATAHHSEVHKHADPFNFEWYSQDRSILVDSGKWGYDNAVERKYVLSTRAHNAVEIDYSDEDINTPPVEPHRIDATSSGGDLYALTASGLRDPSGVAQHRYLFMKAGAWLLVVDVLVADSAHSYTQWFHLSPEFKCTVAADGIYNCGAGDTLLSVTSLQAGVDLELQRGVTEPRLQGWVAPKYHQLVPADALAATMRHDRENAAFATLLSIGDAEIDNVRFSQDKDQVVACWRAGTRVEGVIAERRGSGLHLRPCVD